MSIPRLTLAFALLSLVLTHALALTAIRMRFEWQRAEIEQTLCENRARPELGCHGSCVLRKQLKAAEDATHGLLRLRADALPDFVLPVQPRIPAPPQAPVVVAQEWGGDRSAMAYNHFIGGHFRPPALQIS